MKHPEDFYLKYVLYDPAQQKSMKATKKLKEVQNSTTFKVGKAVMFIPIAIKKALKKLMK